MKPIYLALFIISCYLFGACSQADSTHATEAERLLDKTIAYHDPDGNWQDFAASIQQRSTLARKDETTGEPVRRERQIILDIPKGRFSMEQELEGFPLTRHVQAETDCYSRWENEDITPEEEKKYRLSCEEAKRMRNYFRYLIGLPMVLKDDQAVLRDSVFESSLQGEMLKVITVDYPSSTDRYTYEFFIQPESGALRQVRFFREEPDGSLAGEFIGLEEEVEVQGMKKFGRFVWTFLDGKPLAEEAYTFRSLAIQ